MAEDQEEINGAAAAAAAVADAGKVEGETDCLIKLDGLHGAQQQQHQPKTFYGQVSSVWKGIKRSWAVATVFVFFILLTAAAFISWVDLSAMIGIPSESNNILESSNVPFPHSIPKRPLTPRAQHKPSILYPLNCTANETLTHTCKATNYPSTLNATNESSSATTPNEECPNYFRWIYEDLRPWMASGITREALESAQPLAHFRMVIFQGKAYLEKYHGAFQTRDLFTIWSFVQLLRMFPGRVPDLELMFRLEDRPAVFTRDHRGKIPPVLFQYCAHYDAVGIAYPDWSFWGWVEVNIKPWNLILEKIKEGASKTKWEDRIPYAFWKGNKYTSHNRQELMKCSHNARLYQQDWVKESAEGFHHSNLEDQCDHRYKIYIEGVGWSVSDKYILACDSMTLLVTPEYFDFYLRSMEPLQHYWPISPHNLCEDIKFAVDWGNNNPKKAKAIGKTGSDFMGENLKMEYVYTYMLHVLTEYSKLLKFKPTVPPVAVEICGESMACFERDVRRTFMEESMVMSPSDSPPCTMPKPFEPQELQALLKKNEDIRNLVEEWVKEG